MVGRDFCERLTGEADSAPRCSSAVSLMLGTRSAFLVSLKHGSGTA